MEKGKPITAEVTEAIVARLVQGIKHDAIAAEFNISPSSVARIKQRAQNGAAPVPKRLSKQLEPALQETILTRLAQGETQVALAKEYGIAQQSISKMQRKRALGNGMHTAAAEKDVNTRAGTRGFIAQAWQAREDALWDWKTVDAKTPLEWDLIIDAANGAASAWKKAAMELERRRK